MRGNIFPTADQKIKDKSMPIDLKKAQEILKTNNVYGVCPNCQAMTRNFIGVLKQHDFNLNRDIKLLKFH